jgi:hypothetical protein
MKPTICSLVAVVLLSLGAHGACAVDPKFPDDLDLEEKPTDAKAIKIVLIAGSNYFKPGEHDYIAGCLVLRDLLKQTPNVFPVLALDWPKKPETFANAKCIVFLFDGGEKHAFLKEKRMEAMRTLADAGVGFVNLHQVIDVPNDLGERIRQWMGGAWEKGYSQRAHWIHEFTAFPDHPVCRGVTPFKIDDGWLTKLRFLPEKKGVTPLLRTVAPKSKAVESDDEAIVAWAFEREGKGRSFTFTGCHLHVSFAEEGYRRFLTNSILWAAGVDVPKTGAPVNLSKDDLPNYLQKAPPMKK